MHACFQIGDTQIMASDGQCSGKPSFQGFSLSLTVPDDADREAAVRAPWARAGRCRCRSRKTFFSPSFGMVADRFGVSWMVYVAPKQSVSAQHGEEPCSRRSQSSSSS